MQYFPLNNAMQVLNGLTPYYGAADECPICIAPFENEEVVGHHEVRVVNGERKVLGLSHAVHKECIKFAFEEFDYKKECPICRLGISQEWFNNGINATVPRNPPVQDPLGHQDNFDHHFPPFQIHQQFIQAPPPLTLIGRVYVILGRIFDEVMECALGGAVGCCLVRVAVVVAKTAFTVLSGGLAPSAGVFFTAVLVNGVDGLVLGAACGGIGAIIANIFELKNNLSDPNVRYYGASYTSLCGVMYREIGLGLTHSIMVASGVFTVVSVVYTVSNLIFKR